MIDLALKWLLKVRFSDFSSSKLTNKVIQMLLGLAFQMLMGQSRFFSPSPPQKRKLSVFKLFPADLLRSTAACFAQCGVEQ